MTAYESVPKSRAMPNGLYHPKYERDACGVGFICDIKGRASRRIMEDANHMNCCMVHRGGLGYEKNTGDGAGILTAIPHEFMSRAFGEATGGELPAKGKYGVGIVFLPQNPRQRKQCQAVVEESITELGQTLLGWREVPVDPRGADIGTAAHEAMPHMAQCFIGSSDLESSGRARA